MKKVLLIFAAVLVSISAMAADLNVYASGLKAHGMRADKSIKVDYLLNAPATALEIHVLKSDKSVALTVPITDEALLTKGNHVYSLDLSSLAVGDYSWEIKATASPTIGITEVTDADAGIYNYYMPMGIAVDKSTESPYFGRIYVTESMDGAPDGASDRTKSTTEGVFIYDPLLQDVTNQGVKGYAGGVKWAPGGATDNRQGPKRIVVDETGMVFICDNFKGSDDAPATSGIWMMNPADPKADFTEVLSVKKRKETYIAISSLDVKGSGADRIIYAIDNISTSTGGALKFAVGDCSKPYEGAGDTIFDAVGNKLGNFDTSIREDGNGGFWVAQHRWDAEPYPPLMHFNSAGERDFLVDNSNKATYLPFTNNISYRGQLDLNLDKTLLAMASDKKVAVFKITYGEGGVPDLNRIYETPELGGNIDGVAFDAAGNLYAASASSERFFAFATPKEENTHTTLAPSTQMLKVLDEVVDVAAVKLEPTETEIWVGDQLNLKATIEPENATDKTIAWSSSDEEIAIVSAEGVVTALKAGEATITASASEGEKTATCVITVKNVAVTGIKLNTIALSLFAGESELLVATLEPANATNKTVLWTSSDETIAVVSETGLVSAKSPGTATITATTEDGELTATCEVTVPVGAYPNIMAYGLKIVDDHGDGCIGQEITIGFNLNAPATKVTVYAYDEDGNSFVVGSAENLKNEYQTLKLELTSLTLGKTYTWAVEAEADLVAEDEPVLVRQYATSPYTKPRGVAVDRNPNSPYFGNVYVSEGGTSAETSGVYIYDAKLSGGEQLYGSDFTADHASPMRLFVAEDGLVFAADWTDSNPNVHVINPANPTENKVVFGGKNESGIFKTEDGTFIHGEISGIYVQGTGENRYLYTFDADYTPQALLRYKIGNMESLYEKKPGKVVYTSNENFLQNGNSDIISDKHGGWWITQDRATDNATIPALIHVKSDMETVDFNSSGILGGRTRGATTFNEDFSYCVSASDNSLRVWAVSYGEDSIPTLKIEQSMVTTFGAQNSSSCYQIAIDRAMNVYASGDGKSLHVWALIKDENKCLTPAPDSEQIYMQLGGIENIENNVIGRRGVYTVTGQYLGESAELLDLPKGVYIINGEKVVK